MIDWKKLRTRDYGRVALLAAAVLAVIAAFSPRDGAPLVRAGNRKEMSDFRLPVVGGGSWSLADQRGRVVLLNFWATWCPPCRRETPELVQLARRYGPAGLSMAGISMDDQPRAVVPNFVSRYQIPYPILAPGADFPLADGIDSLPTTILLDRQGRVAKTYFGAVSANDVAGDIERLLSD